MNISKKIKVVTLETAISVILAKENKSVKRTARYIYDVGISIGGNDDLNLLNDKILEELEVLLKENDKIKLIQYSIDKFL